MIVSTNSCTNSLGAPSDPAVSLPLYRYGSCVTCRRRKVKCDKAIPCSNCARLGTQCDYQPRKRAVRRPWKTWETNRPSVREGELINRLKKLEAVVEDLGGQADTDGRHNLKDFVPTSSDTNVEGITPPQFEARKGGGYEEGPSKSSPDSTAPLEKDIGTLVISEGGPSRYMSNSSFARLSEQVDNIVQVVYEDCKDDDDDSSSATQEELTPPEKENENENENDHQGFIFGYSSYNGNLRALHPLPSQLPFYLQVYRSKVDPLAKLLHIPSLEEIIKEAAEKLDSLSKSNEVLLFSIYLSVITSMSVDEVRKNFASDKKILFDRYCFATEQALARAGFLVSSDLITLQAFVLYLTVIRCQFESHDSRIGWTLTRSAIGIAQWLGLHRDGSRFGFQPFECEMRRRVWWHICYLDFRNAEMQGTEPSIIYGTFDTKFPLNINDSDISPQSAAVPESRVGLTEMTLSLIAMELASTSMILQRERLDKTPMTSLTGSATSRKDAIIQEFCQHLQDTYVKYCTDSSPTAWQASNMCQLFIDKMESVLRPPLSSERSQRTKKLSDQIFIKSIRIVELRCNLREEKTKQWHWYTRTGLPWHAVVYLLSELCFRGTDENVNWAWKVLDAMFQEWKKVEEWAPGVLWQPMRKLIAKARRKRELDLEAVRKREGEAAKARVAEYQDMNTGYDALLPTIDATFRTTDDSQNITVIEHAGYQEQWLHQPQQYGSTSTPIPWQLEDSVLQNLSLDMKGLDTDMEWEGPDDLMQEFYSLVGEDTDVVSGGWGPVW